MVMQTGMLFENGRYPVFVQFRDSRVFSVEEGLRSAMIFADAAKG
jgi:hypothetical protein